MGCKAESHPWPPELEEGVKQILWSPESAAVNVKRPDDEPFWVTTRWSLSNTSCDSNSSQFLVSEKGGLKVGGEYWEGGAYIDGDEDIDAIMFRPLLCILVIFLRDVFSNHERILW